MSFGIPVRNGLMLGLGASTALSTRTGIRPAMALNFLQPFLDSRITFSRGTNATLIDSTGKLTYAPANLLLNSEGTVAQLNASGNVTDAAPTISGFANSIQFGDNSVTRFAYKTLTLSGGVPLIASFFVQMDDNSAPVVGTGATGGDLAIIIDGVYAPTVNVSLVSGSIYRVSGLLAAPTGGGFRNVGIIKNTGQSAKGFRVTGFQLEQVTYQTTPSTYVATTASAYYGPRFDYDPVTLAPRGLLIEEARTNLLTYSEQFDNAAWTKTRSSVVANTTTSPDGTANADTLVEDTTAAATHPISAAVTLTAAAHAYSVYLKANGRSWAQLNLLSTANAFANFNLSTGAIGVVGAAATASIQNAGNGWYRCTIVATTAAGANTAAVYPASADNVISFTGSGAAALFLYGADLEAGGFTTSYIPTVASTVTRNADVAAMTGTNFSSWYNQSEGTFVAETSLATAVRPRSEGIVGVSNGSSAESTAIYRAGATSSLKGEILDGGVAQASYTVAMGGQPDKSSFAYALNNSNFALNGAAQTTDTVCTIPTPDRLLIGAIYSGGDFPTNGHIRTIAYFNTRLPNAQLQTLTAPSLATTLSLDFTSGSYNVGF